VRAPPVCRTAFLRPSPTTAPTHQVLRALQPASARQSTVQHPIHAARRPPSRCRAWDPHRLPFG
ncbi:hypothetical protein B0H19DRAFT_1111557, partial [Mycena capillaripes]